MRDEQKQPKGHELSPLQTLAWRVMTLVAMIGVYFVLSRENDIREPFVAGVFIAISLAIAFFSRKFVRDNSDSDGKPLKRKK
jgi:L-asparagine transporter-like permease